MTERGLLPGSNVRTNRKANDFFIGENVVFALSEMFYLAPGALYLLAGRPGNWHEAYAWMIARQTMLADRTVFWLAAESSSKRWQVAQPSFMGSAAERLIFDDRILHTPGSLRSCLKHADKVRVSSGLPPVGLIVVDSIQSVVDKREYRRKKPETGLRALRALARKFEAPVVALSSLPRKIERRKNQHPVLDDLNHYAAHELADGVIFTFNESNYDPESGQKDWIRICFAKNRHGLVGGDAVLKSQLLPERGRP